MNDRHPDSLLIVVYLLPPKARRNNDGNCGYPNQYEARIKWFRDALGKNIDPSPLHVEACPVSRRDNRRGVCPERLCGLI